MKSLLTIYLSHADDSLPEVMKALHVNEDRLKTLILNWIDQGFLPKDNPHLEVIKIRRAERKEKELLERRHQKLLHYQNLRDSGLSQTKAAELMGHSSERMQSFFFHEIERLQVSDIPSKEAAHELRMTIDQYHLLEKSYEQQKKQQAANLQRKLKDNRIYARTHLNGLKSDLENGTSHYLIFDLEASQQPDELIEISLIDIHGHLIMDQLICPSGHINYHISKLTGITDAMVADHPSIHEMMPILKDIVDDKILLSWGTDYDKILLNNAMATTGITLNCQFGCAQRIHMGVVGSSKQIALGTAANVSNQSHRALDDCLLVRKVLLNDLQNTI